MQQDYIKSNSQMKANKSIFMIRSLSLQIRQNRKNCKSFELEALSKSQHLVSEMSAFHCKGKKHIKETRTTKRQHKALSLQSSLQCRGKTIQNNSHSKLPSIIKTGVFDKKKTALQRYCLGPVKAKSNKLDDSKLLVKPWELDSRIIERANQCSDLRL